MGSITKTISTEVDVEVEIDLDELSKEELRELGLITGIDLGDPHVEAMVYGLKNGDREAVFQAARNWVRVHSSLCV
ncbi:hypothetical protein [Oceanimonas smirnovii]|uniref:hypothetical protein n=1 Tax=Oceanimonas smirnovii TaxID=264574 RepID=UPI00036F3173|nr:hypothetical protein [Oceanimonas smirnovii]